MIGAHFEHHQLDDSDYIDLKIALERYLSLGSCDGRIERREMREKLAKMIGAEYDSSNNAIKGS